jgi:hypothetical protein
MKNECDYCKRFFARYRCNKPDECDCPKCQGYCECKTKEALPKKPWTKPHLRKLLPILLLVGCAQMPTKTVEVTWAEASCAQKKVIRFVDSPVPVLDCIRHSSPGEGLALGALLILGMPASACAIRYKEDPVATIYMALSSPAAEIWAGQVLRSPAQLLEWEIDNAMNRTYWWLAPWLQTCL